MTVAESLILGAHVLATYIGGRAVFGRAGSADHRPAILQTVSLMVPPIAELGPATQADDGRYPWLSPSRLTRVRAALLAVSLFLGLVVYVFHTVGASHSADILLVKKLRGVGVLTWLYALVQMIDLRFYNSRWAQRRRASIGIPDSLHGWLFGQMLAWFGILYYGLTEDLRWYVAGLVILALSFVAFPIRKRSI